jgi:hypothetical protein
MSSQLGIDPVSSVSPPDRLIIAGDIRKLVKSLDLTDLHFRLSPLCPQWTPTHSSTMDRVQLGTLLLDLRTKDLDDCSSVSEASETGWIPVTSSFIDSGLLDDLTISSELVALLAELLADPGIGFEASCRPWRSNLVVRCSLITSDGRGADWRKKPKRDRGRALKSLFRYLRSGWYGEGELLLARRVSPRANSL